MNFVERLIAEGFVETLNTNFMKKRDPSYKFSTKNNWFGVSTYHPDAILECGTKKLILSLMGAFGYEIYIRNVPNGINESFNTLSANRAVKIILLMNGNNVVYSTFSGEVPSEDIITEFLK